MKAFFQNKRIAKRWLLILIAVLSLGSCKEQPMSPIDNPPLPNEDGIADYLFLGHIYFDDKSIDERIEAKNLDSYSQIWLGGDVCSETTASFGTLQYLDEQFDLGSRTTHWTLGNHDIRNGNIDWITNKTERPTFYTSHFDGVTLLVLNTTFAHGGIYDTIGVQSQYNLIREVCDTIAESSHLILLSHYMVWNAIDSERDNYAIANANFPSFLFNIEPNLKYENGIYPLLVEVRQRGVEVIHIVGDLGQKLSSYEFMSTDSIHYLGSGITSQTEYNSQFPTAGKPDSILILHHDLEERSIDWTFEELD